MGSAQSRYYPAPRKGDRSPVTVSIEQLTGTRRPSPGGQGRGQTRPLTHPMCARQEVGWSRHYGGSGNLFREGSQERRWRAHLGATEQIPGQSLAAGRRCGHRAPGSQTRSLQPGAGELWATGLGRFGAPPPAPHAALGAASLPQPLEN